MIPILQVIYSVFSGSLLALAIPNELYLMGCPVFTLVALVPFYLVFGKIKNYKAAFGLGFCYTITTHLISSFWLAYFKEFAFFTLGASAFGTGLIGGFAGLFFYLPYASAFSKNTLNLNALSNRFLTDRLFHSSLFRILYFACTYTAYEWIKSSGFLGYPWGTIFSAMFRWPVLMQLSSVTGPWGITFFIASINALLAEFFLYNSNLHIIQNKKARSEELTVFTKLLAVFAIVIILHGFYQYNRTRKPIKTLTTILVQQNSDPWKEVSDTQSILLSQKLTQEQLDKLNALEKKADLVVWSEGCLRRTFPKARIYYQNFPDERPLMDFINSTQTPFILGGAFERDKKLQKIFNASILFDAEGNYRGVYGKNHLVPFAEAVPFVEYPVVSNFLDSITDFSRGWAPGDQYVFFDIPCKITKHYKLPAVDVIDLNKSFEHQKQIEKTPYTVRIATPICFDDSFPDIMRPLFLNGAELFVNITDDSWSLTRSSEIQHFAIAVYSAIEYRTTLVRSSNAGYSVVVEPSGKIIGDLPLFKEAAGTFEVPVFERTMTTFARFGNWFAYAAVLLVLAYALYSYFIFSPCDYIPDERKLKKKSKAGKKKSKSSKKSGKK